MKHTWAVYRWVVDQPSSPEVVDLISHYPLDRPLGVYLDNIHESVSRIQTLLKSCDTGPRINAYCFCLRIIIEMAA